MGAGLPARAGAAEALDRSHLLAPHHTRILAVCQLHAVLAELAVPANGQILLRCVRGWGACMGEGGGPHDGVDGSSCHAHQRLCQVLQSGGMSALPGQAGRSGRNAQGAGLRRVRCGWQPRGVALPSAP